MLYYLFRHYAQTKFHSNLIGSRFFCVDLTWNDPHVTSLSSRCMLELKLAIYHRATNLSSQASQ